MIAWVLALAPPLLAAGALTTLARARDRFAVAPLAFAVAVAASSTVWGALLFGGVRSRPLILGCDAAFWLLLAFVIYRWRVPGETVAARRLAPTNTPRAATFAAVALLLVTASIAVASFAASSAVLPHGEWDAWAQWNLRARFFFRGFASGAWRQAFAPVLAWSHADYPPLVPLAVSRMWLYIGTDTTAVPIALSGAFASVAVGAAGLATARVRDTARGCVAAAAILACPSFVRYASAQCADVPLALLMLAAFIFWSLADGPTARTWLGLAGLSAGLAAWTKNEGIPFLAVFVALVAIERLRHAGLEGWRDVAAVLAGAAPLVLLVVVFKATLAPPSYFTAEQSLAEALTRLTDAGRLQLVVTAIAREAWLTGAAFVGVIPFLALYLIARGASAEAPVAAKAAAPAMIAMLVIYAVAYLITPKDLPWQLRTSLDRVFVQLVPTLAWSVVTIAR